MESLQIEVVEVSAERTVARMPIGPRVFQPFGILHGGASVALAETAASIAATAAAPEGFIAVGLEINANHLRPMQQGVLEAVATPLHRGRNTHVWRIELHDEQGRRVCEARCTLAIVPAEAMKRDAP